MGGSNNPDNLVKLTVREHFICHLLLTKMTTGTNRRKAWMGLRMMVLGNAKTNSRGDLRITSKIFSQIRVINKLPDTPEIRQRKSIAQLARQHKHDELTLQKMRAAVEKRLGHPPRNRVFNYPRRPKWTVISPTGTTTNIWDLTEYCNTQELCKPTLSLTTISNMPAPELIRTRNDTSLKRRNVIGWKLIKW